MTELEQKKTFCIAWLRLGCDPEESFRAACQVFLTDTGAALRASMNWPIDAEVIKIRDELLNEFGEDAFLPSKGDATRLAWAIANDDKLATKDRIAALSLFSELQKFITKGSQTVIDNSTKTLTNNVMQVPMPASADEWQEKAKMQQKQLVSNARPTH